MKPERIKTKEFSQITGYTERNLYYIRDKDPALLGFNPIDKTYSRKKALSLANILAKYTPRSAASILKMTEASVRYHIRQLKLGTKINRHIYLTLEDIRTIDTTPYHKRGPKFK